MKENYSLIVTQIVYITTVLQTFASAFIIPDKIFFVFFIPLIAF